MGLPRIFGLLIAAYFIPLVGFAKNEVSTIRNPTTLYHKLIDRDIPASGSSNARDVQVRNDPTHKGRLLGNGPNLQQTVEGKVTIEGLKGETKLKGKAKFSKKGAAKGLSRGLKFGKLGGPYGLVITTGLGLAIDKLIEESGQDVPDSYFIDSQTGEIYAKYGDDVDPNSIFNKPAMVNRCEDYEKGEASIKKIKQAIWDVENKPKFGTELCAGPAYQYREHPKYYYRDEYNQFVVIGWYAPSGGTCWTDEGMDDFNNYRYGGSPSYKTNFVEKVPNCVHFYRDSRTVLVDDSIIDLVDSIDLDALFDKWGAKDYEQIFPYIDEIPTLEFEVPESIVHDVQNSSFTGPDGATYQVENIAQTDFSSDGLGGFTAQTSEIQNTYKDGALVDTQVSSSSTNVSGQTSSGGSGAGNQPPPEIPTDCDLFPTHCEHIEFMEEAPPSGELEKIWNGEWINIQDALKVQDLEVTEEKIVNFAVPKACPAPRQIEVKFLNRIFNFEWTPICTIMEILGYIVLGLAYYVAMRIYMGIFRF